MDYFELKTINTQKTQKETLTFPLISWKNLNKIIAGVLSPEVSAQNMG